MAKIEPFETLTERYEQWFENYHYAYISEIEAIKKLLPVGKGIEVGVGSGRFAQPLGIRYGIEPSSKMAKIAKKRGINVIRGVAELLPIKNSSFDFCLFVTTICFVDDIKKSFLEANRILKKDGKVIVGFIDKNSIVGRYYMKHKEENPFYRHATFYSTEDIINILKKTGFENFRLVQTIFHKLNETKKIEPVKEGYGEGSFVVISASKK